MVQSEATARTLIFVALLSAAIEPITATDVTTVTGGNGALKGNVVEILKNVVGIQLPAEDHGPLGPNCHT